MEALDAYLWSKPRYMSLWAIHNGGQVTYSNLLKLPKAEYAEGFIGIDCACCAVMPESRLACLRLDDMEEFYVH